MPAVSTPQRRLFGMALAYKRGQLPHTSKQVKDLAASMTEDVLRDFAVTKDREITKVATTSTAGFKFDNKIPQPIKSSSALPDLERAAGKVQDAVDPILEEKAPMTARPEDKKHREALIDEARIRHYQDQPFGTSAMVGGGIGLSVPWVLAAIMAPKMYRNNADISRLAQLSAAGGLVGTGTGLGAEALGRLLTRGFGPNFKPSQWHRDQDPHRWNSALRTAPIAVAALGGKALSTMFNEIERNKDAGTMANVQDGPKPPSAGLDLSTPDGQANVLGTAVAAKATASAAAAPPTLAGLATKAAPVAAKGVFGKGVSLLGKGLGKAVLPWTVSNALGDTNLHGGLDYEGQQTAVNTMRNDWNTSGWKGKTLTALGALDAPVTAAKAVGILPGTTPPTPSSMPPAHIGPPPTGIPRGSVAVPTIKPAPLSPGWGAWGAKFRPQQPVNQPQPLVTNPTAPPVKQAGNDQALRNRIAAAYRQVTIPNLKEIEHGQYQKGHFSWKGLGITIESAPGAMRRGVDKDGTAWSVKLKNAYGYIKGTTSAEPGDQMDIFMGPHPESEIVFVVDQNKQNTKTFDEHKCVIGCRTAAEAKELYIKNYSDSWTGFRDITPLTIPQLKSWLRKGDMTKPLAGQQFQDFHKQAHSAVATALF